MVNESSQQNEQTNNGGAEPINQTPGPAPASSSIGGGMKTIQPLDPNLKVDTTPLQPPAQSSTAKPPLSPINTSVMPEVSGTEPPKPNANSSSIYPDATLGMNATTDQSSSHNDNNKDIGESYKFRNGYSIGGSIFWFQLLVGIVLNIIFFGVITAAIKSNSGSVVRVVSIIYYLVELIILIYIPYKTLLSNQIKNTFWLTLFGAATQLVIIGSFFELVDYLIIRSIINHGVSSSITYLGGSGNKATAIIVYICFFIALYFLTKLVWGIAFSVFGKIKNKVMFKIIGVVIIALFVGGIAYHYLSVKSTENKIKIESGQTTYQNNNNNSPKGSLSDPSVNSYSKVVIKAQDFKVSLNFDPNYSATIYYAPPIVNKNKTFGEYEEVAIKGNELNNVVPMTIIIDKVSKNNRLNLIASNGRTDPISCVGNGTNFKNLDPDLLYIVTIMGQKTAVCTNLEQQSTAREAYIYSDGSWYYLQFTNTTGVTGNYANSVQNIINSIMIS